MLETRIKGKNNKVNLGKRIEISVNGEFQCWDIVPIGESSTLNKKISVDSPLVKLIRGLRTGEKIKGRMGNREVFVKVREVNDLSKLSTTNY